MVAIEPPITTNTTMNENTVNDSVVGQDGSDDEIKFPPTPPPVKHFRWVGLAVLAVVMAVLVGVLNVQIPYYAISPGQALDVGPLVKVEKGPNYSSEGQFFLTTVSLGKATVLTAFLGWIDSSTDVVKESVIRPPSVSDADLTKLNQEEMTDSKQVALGVAFEHLGYDAISGDGAKVVVVEKGAPADSLLVAEDVIVAIDGKQVKDHFQLVKMVRAKSPGTSVAFKVQSVDGSKTRTVDLELGANPNNAEQGFLGVQLTTNKLRFDFPYELKLESERIGGPSAGLAYTLQVLDVLTEGDLGAGKKVAVTGTIELDGTVGDVGGVSQKTSAVKEAKVDIFLVPSSEEDEVKKSIGDKVEVVGVDSLSEAIEALQGFGGDIRFTKPL